MIVDKTNFHVIHQSIGEELIVGDTLGERPSILFLHGAGHSNRQRFHHIRMGLYEQNLASVAFDFSGHGDSTFNKESSLIKRFQESLSWWAMLSDSPIRCLIGFSMGAEIAIRLGVASNIKATHLILVAGALYNRHAFETPFGESFSSIIRKPNSWQDAETFDLLEKFKGHITVISAERDHVIPPTLHAQIVAAAKNAKSAQQILLHGIEHTVALRSQKDPAFAKQFVSILINALGSDQ